MINSSALNFKNEKISLLSRILLAIAGCLLFAALLFPIWKIELSAPQYPEGLNLYLHADKIAGDVNSINDLNHYIGMKELYTEDFIEFTVLPYIISFFGLLTLACAFIGKKKWAIFTLFLFLVFGIVSLFDFYNWNYNYGHDLSPKAAIQVPGMAYQPPIIGYKQLLNFGVYSIPALGGILMILSGVLMAFVTIKECKIYKLFSKKANVAALVAGMVFITMSCTGKVEPRPINMNKDTCAGCKMTITDLKFATEFITDKGKIYVFDDLSCMIHYLTKHSDIKAKALFVPDYLLSNELLKLQTAFFVKGDRVRSPMGGNIAAFKTQDAAEMYAKEFHSEVMSWTDLDLPAGVQ